MKTQKTSASPQIKVSQEYVNDLTSSKTLEELLQERNSLGRDLFELNKIISKRLIDLEL